MWLCDNSKTRYSNVFVSCDVVVMNIMIKATKLHTTLVRITEESEASADLHCFLTVFTQLRNSLMELTAQSAVWAFSLKFLTQATLDDNERRQKCWRYNNLFIQVASFTCHPWWEQCPYAQFWFHSLWWRADSSSEQGSIGGFGRHFSEEINVNDEVSCVWC